MKKGLSLKGNVEKIKVLKLEEMPLVRFTLTTKDKAKKIVSSKPILLIFYSRLRKGSLL